MKELIYILFTILLVIGCGHSKPAEERLHVFHTYYGDIDVDTMSIAFERDSHNWYLVRHVEKDSFNWDGRWFNLNFVLKFVLTRWQ